MKFHRGFWICVTTIVGMMGLDQGFKAFVRSKMFEGQAWGAPWPGVFETKLTFNEGIAFGMFQGRGIVFAPIALVIAIGCLWWSKKHEDESWLTHLAVGLLGAGAAGNLIDRVVFNRVTDMLWFRAINFPVFNIADACISVGVILLFLISMVTSKAREDAKDTADPSTEYAFDASKPSSATESTPPTSS